MSTLIGIDLGVHKIALAVFIGNSLAVTHSYESTAQERDQQLMQLGHYALDVVQLHAADAVWIEDVLVGNNHKYSLRLAETKGAVLGSLAHLRPGCDLRMVNVKAWKKEVVGNGNAGKEQVSNYIVATHPAYAAVCDGDQDRIDATCVGLYGLRITARAAELRLAE